MKRLGILGLILSSIAWPRSGRRDVLNPLETILRHQQNVARHSRAQAARPEQQPADVVLPDSGNIAVMDGSEGVVAAAGFDLDQKTLEFKPAGANASQYTFDVAASRFDSSAPATATPITLGDDEEKQVPLPFSFPFFGKRYTSLFIGSDGHIVFGVAEGADVISTPRDLLRTVTGPARIAPLFTDLDPSQPGSAVSYASSPTRFLVTWQSVPTFASTPGPTISKETFQAALYPDGRIEFNYNGIDLTTEQDAISVGIAPGGALLNCQVVTADYSVGSTKTFAGAVVEEFFTAPQFDDLEIPLKFYKNHEDAYDVLVVFDSVSRPEVNACAFNQPIKNWVHGLGTILQTIGISEFDASTAFGSAGRLQSLVYMGPLSRYPSDPNQVTPLTGACGTNSVTSILGQETGHRFLAYPAFLDPATGQSSTDLLGRDLEHWSFYFNSDASVMEGNRIVDHGTGVSPRFETTDIVLHYSALDQYMMGLRAPGDVPGSFLVRNPSIDFVAAHGPQAGILFDGTRLDITLPMITAAVGPRAPDYTLSAKQFHFAFVLLVPAGQTPAAADVAKLDAYRTAWETYFAAATDNNGKAVTSLTKQLELSVWPNAGMIQGRTLSATVTLGSPAAAPVTVSLSASSSAITVPASVTIPAGSRSASFTITGAASGTATLTAQGPDASYETIQAFIKVRSSLAGLTLERLSAPLLDAALIFPFPPTLPLTGSAGGVLGEDILFRVRDESYVPYPGLQLDASPSGAGLITPSSLITNASGRVRFKWKLDSNPGMNTLNVLLDGQPDISGRVQVLGRLQPPRFRDQTQLPACPVTGN
ncbi:MAG TPA: Ig-like domain-containing protein [Bryobacterales bacterium]|nr:Ig-like domain-containing protein [Bryobacterales bacterium]